MVHAQYHAYLENLLQQHAAIPDTDLDAEILFMRNLSNTAAKLLQHAQNAKTLAAAHQQLNSLWDDISNGAAANIKPEQPPAQEPVSAFTNQLTPCVTQPAHWTAAKCAQIAKHPQIHPDEIDRNGRINNRPWLWTEIKRLSQACASARIGEPVNLVALLPGRGLPEIQEKIRQLRLDEPNPAALQISEPFPITYSDEQKMTILATPETWSSLKLDTAQENPEIHPDSISNKGEIHKTPWTWDEIMQLKSLYRDTLIADIQEAIPRHTIQAIGKRLSQLDWRINPAIKAALKAAKQPAPAPEPEPELPPKTDIEDYLPERYQNPDFKTRLRILRLHYRYTVSGLSALTDLTKAQIYDIELGKEEPSDAQLERLAEAYHMSVENLRNKPMRDLVPIEQGLTPAGRIRTLRVRAGLSIEAMAKRLFEKPSVVAAYETFAPRFETVQAIAHVLSIPDWMIQTGKPPITEATRYVAETQTTGDKLHQARIQAGLSMADLAKKVGCSEGHLCRVENGQSGISDGLLSKIGKALNLQRTDLYDLQITQPMAAQTAKTAAKAKQNSD